MQSDKLHIKGDNFIQIDGHLLLTTRTASRTKRKTGGHDSSQFDAWSSKESQREFLFEERKVWWNEANPSAICLIWQRSIAYHHAPCISFVAMLFPVKKDAFSSKPNHGLLSSLNFSIQLMKSCRCSPLVYNVTINSRQGSNPTSFFRVENEHKKNPHRPQ